MVKQRKWFGTDGIRGKANNGKLTAALALQVGQAAGVLFRRGDYRHKVLIGKDTRISSYMLEHALTAGFLSAGMDVFLTGPVPTPSLAMLVRSMRADLGVMITASHNAYHDNGIKLFDSNGLKLSDEKELEIEALIQSDALAVMLADSAGLGRAKRIDGPADRSIEFVKRTFPNGLTLDGLRIVIDGANGAGYKLAPQVLAELGAEVVAIGVEPNGFNINAECGSTAPRALQNKVREVRADIGIALDGDADRVLIVDEQGRVVDGDQILAVIAESWHKEGALKSQCVVGTVLSNLAFERFLNDLGLSLERSAVGDRHVLERMRATSSNLGGEQSGHIIMTDHTTSGDGLVAALQVLAVMKRSGQKASEVCRRFTPVPQDSRDVRRKNGADPLASSAVQKAMRTAEELLADTGRIVVRNSGTEPKVRIMVEGEDQELVRRLVDSIAEAVEQAG